MIAEKGFAAVVIESDWPPTAAVGSALEMPGSSHRVAESLRAFDRFPQWMWRNAEFGELLEWLRAFNLARDGAKPAVRLRGMDLYELAQGVTAVIEHLDAHDPASAAQARERYGCFAPAGMDPQNYGRILSNPSTADCSDPVQRQLTELASAPSWHVQSGISDADPAYFHALQSARAVRNAEEYFRALYGQPASAWNIRDAHMASSIDLLLAHLDAQTSTRARIVIWAHNAHIGDARATDRGDGGGWTLGQLLRERYPDDVFGIGLMTSVGSVHAATEWGGPGERKTLRRPVAGSHAALFSGVRLPKFYCLFGDSEFVRRALSVARPQRGIGVRYLPALEMNGHYYRARLSRQFDAVVHIERTSALHPRVDR
jgi:erythromycin esterase-like protein